MSGSIIPNVRYRDAHAAIDLLQEAFGFDLLMLVKGDGTIVEHAQLTHGSGMVMVSSIQDSEFARVADEGRDPAGHGSTYIVVADPFAHAEVARAHGANIIMEPEDQDYGGAVYVAKDAEGNIWSFGSYDPWATAAG